MDGVTNKSPDTTRKNGKIKNKKKKERGRGCKP